MIRFKGIRSALGFCLSLGAWDVYASSKDGMQHFESLNGDVQRLIFVQLSDDDLRSCARASKGMSVITSQDRVWESRINAYYIFPMDLYTSYSSIAKEIIGGTYTPTYDDQSLSEPSEDWTLNDFNNFNNEASGNLSSLIIQPYPRFKTLIQCRFLVAEQLGECATVGRTISGIMLSQIAYERLLVAAERLGKTVYLSDYFRDQVNSSERNSENSIEDKSNNMLQLFNKFIEHGSVLAQQEKDSKMKRGLIINTLDH